MDSHLLVALRLEGVSWLQWTGIVMSLAGVGWFLLEAQSANPSSRLVRRLALLARRPISCFGNALTLVAALLFAIDGIVIRPWARDYSPPELMCYTLIIGTLALARSGFRR